MRQPALTRKYTADELQSGAVLNVYKPKGMTSFAVVKKVRHITGAGKAGHAGTLDPLATGVLIVCTGRATKKTAEFVNMKKEYEAVIRLGIRSDTDDMEGKIVEERAVPPLSIEEIRRTAEDFRGEILQVPPMYSALHKDGKRLYKLAREGKQVERLPRPVTVYDIKITSWHNPDIGIHVLCGRGTYIRAIARDLGKRLGTAGMLASLVRTRVGPYAVSDSLTLKELEKISAGKDGHIQFN